MEIPPQKGPKFLRYGGDFKILCRCHYNTEKNYPHPVDLEPSESLKRRIPHELPLQDGKVTCATCHQIFNQCHDKPQDKIFLKEVEQLTIFVEPLSEIQDFLEMYSKVLFDDKKQNENIV